MTGTVIGIDRGIIGYGIGRITSIVIGISSSVLECGIQVQVYV